MEGPRNGYGKVASDDLMNMYRDLKADPDTDAAAIVSILAVIAGRAYLSGDMKTVVEVLGPEANLILAADIPGDSRLALLEMLSEAYAIEGLYVEACKCAQTILRLTSKEDPEESDYLAKIFAYTVQGSVMRLLGQAQLAIDCYEKAAQPILDGDCRTPDSLYKRVFIPLAEVHGENGNTQEMLDAYRECDLTIESDSQAPDKILFKIQKEASKAFFVLQYGLETDAAESAKSAWAQWVKYRDMSEALENIPEIIGSLEILGFNSMLTADYEFAGQAYQQALSMAGKRSSRSDYHLLAHLNYAQGVAKLMLSKRAGDLHTADMQEVVDLFREAVRCQVLTGDVSGPEYPEYCFYYGWAFMSLGKEDYWKALVPPEHVLLLDRRSSCIPRTVASRFQTMRPVCHPLGVLSEPRLPVSLADLPIECLFDQVVPFDPARDAEFALRLTAAEVVMQGITQRKCGGLAFQIGEVWSNLERYMQEQERLTPTGPVQSN